MQLPSDRVRDEARRAIEAVVLVAEAPLAPQLVGQLLELSPVVVEELCRELADEYEADGRGFQLVRVAGGWRYQTHPDQAPYVERFVLEGQTAKLSAAALETLAIVAYKQPISRAQVAAIRGVSVDGVMRTLQQRGYIAEVGRDPGPGQAVLFGTSRSFLEQLGLDGLDDLPPLGGFVPDAGVVEQLEQGLRPAGPAAPDRYDGFDTGFGDDTGDGEGGGVGEGRLDGFAASDHGEGEDESRLDGFTARDHDEGDGDGGLDGFTARDHGGGDGDGGFHPGGDGHDSGEGGDGRRP